MARPSAALTNFKKVEIRLRDAANNCRSAIVEIDASLARGRTEKERALLLELRRDTQETHKACLATLGKLFDAVGA